MSKPLNAAQLRAALTKWGVDAQLHAGYATRGRPGAFEDVKGIIIHHTASDSQSADYLDFLFRHGRSDLPAPLCHVATDKKGRVHVGALGRANHAGKGSLGIYNKVQGERVSLTSNEKPGPDAVDGNARFYGNEVMYAGTKPMSKKQYAAVVRWCAAICDAHGWSAQSIIGHKEWTRRKVDPGHTSMAQLRRDVQALLDERKGQAKVAPLPGVYLFVKESIRTWRSLLATEPMEDRTDGPVIRKIRKVRWSKTANDGRGEWRGRSNPLVGRWYTLSPERAKRLRGL